MTAFDATRARAYLLGRTSDQETQAIEQEYFRSDEALESIDSVEEALIEEYLAGRLAADDRMQFERHYLTSPQHQVRVQLVRRLSGLTTSAAAVGAAKRVWPSLRALAVAASLVLIAGAGFWVARSRSVAPPPRQPAAPAPSIRAFEFVLSPATVRGLADTAALVVPTGTDVVALQLEGEAGAPPVARGRVVIRTVSGHDVWQGPVTSASNLRPGVLAAAEIPAVRLAADDYTVTLLEISSSGAESERERYFLRVRAR